MVILFQEFQWKIENIILLEFYMWHSLGKGTVLSVRSNREKAKNRKLVIKYQIFRCSVLLVEETLFENNILKHQSVSTVG